MKIQTIIHCKNKTFTSSVSDELSERQLKEWEDKIIKTMKGHDGILILEMNDETVYFPKKVLEESIIKIIVTNN